MKGIRGKQAVCKRYMGDTEKSRFEIRNTLSLRNGTIPPAQEHCNSTHLHDGLE
jgi:hypothetical protein